MKLLILSVTAGHGHNKTSQALLSAWEALGHEGVILDTYEFLEPIVGKSVDKGYLMSTKYTPKLYGAVYSFLDKQDLDTLENVPSFSSKEMREKIEEYIVSYAPDAIVCPHVFTAEIMSKIKDSIGNIPVWGIITDYTIHPFWQTCQLDGYVIPNELLKAECQRKGMSLRKIYPTGIPVSPVFKKKIAASEARAQLSLDPEKRTVMLMTGSMGFGNIGKIVERLDQLPSDFQMLVITGNNKRAYRSLSKKEWTHPMHIYGFVNNVDVMMDASDVLITKPGGLSVSESLVKGLPMILINPIPGHEKRNMEFLVNCGVAMATSKTCAVEDCVYMYMENEWLRDRMRASVGHIRKPDAAENLAEILIDRIRRKNVGEDND